jgi:hypothetical protein
VRKQKAKELDSFPPKLFWNWLPGSFSRMGEEKEKKKSPTNPA